MAPDSDVAFTATLAERDDYVAWFVGSGGSVAADSIPMDGARAFFLQSGLPTDTLSHVWRLANRASLPNGALNFADFCIAAHLLMRIARKQIESPPATLSPAFFAQADAFAKGKPAPAPNPFPSSSSSSGPASSLLLDDFGGASMTTSTTTSSPLRAATGASTPLGPIESHRTGASTTSHPPVSAIPAHRTGGSIMSAAIGSGSPIAGTPRGPPPIPVGRAATILEIPTGTGSPVRGPSPVAGATLPRGGGGEWGVPQDKQTTYAGYFTQVDVGAKGFATGAECFDMFTKSGLPTSDLSKIWNLVSTESGGAHLRKDDFIVAMHLIFEKLAGKPIPDTLPADLIPPSRRSAGVASSPVGAFAEHGIKNTSSTVSLASVIGGHAPSAATALPPSGPAVPPSTSNPKAPTSFDDIIGGGSSSGPSIGLGLGLGSAPTSKSPTPAAATPSSASAFSAVPPPTRAPTLPPSSAAGPTFGSGPSLYGGTPGLSSAMMANLPAAALPEAKELSDLVTKTESLTMQRIESTHALNQISIERQNLQIRLDQARVTCDAEERILKEMKAALEAETETVKELKNELSEAEKKRTEMQDESRTLQEQIRRDRVEAEALRGKLVTLNLEIAGMRQEINKLREEANRERQAKESAEQTAQNVEDAKGMVQMTLESERSKKMERDVLGGGPVTATGRVGSVEAVGGSASRPVSTAGSIGAKSPLARPGSIGSPSATPFSLESLGKSPVMDPFPVATNKTGNSVASGTGFGGSTSVTTSNPALATDGRAKSPAPSMGNGVAPSSASVKSFDMSAAMANFPSPSQLPTMPLSPPPALAGMGSPAQTPASAPVDTAAAIPEDLKRQFEEDFSFDMPAPVPAQAPPATSSTAEDPFAMFTAPAGKAAASGPSSAPATAPSGVDAFDPFGFAAPASTPGLSSAPTSAVPPTATTAPTSAPADAASFDPFGTFNNPPAAAVAPASSSLPTSPDPFSGFDSIVAHSPPTQPVAATAPPAGGAARSPSPTSGGDPVATVMAMGFTKEQAVHALERYDFKAELAINYLFDQQNAK